MGSSDTTSAIRLCVMAFPAPSIPGGGSLLKQFISIIEPLAQKVYLISGGPLEIESDKVRIMANQKSWSPSLPMWSRLIRHMVAQLRSTGNLIKVSRDCDIVILYGGAQLYLMSVIIAKLLRKKIILVNQGLYSDMKNLSLLHRALALVEKIAFHLSDKLVFESSGVVKFHGLERYGKKIHFTEHRYIDSNIFRIKKKLEDRRKLTGYVGRFLREKGVEQFTRAIPLVLQEHKDAKFVMVGAGDLFDKIKAELKQTNSLDRVNVVGWIHPQKVPDFLNEFRLLILPSLSEGLPSVVLEAMACGTPVLATAVGGVPDVIKDGETGFILEDNSPECIARNIVRVLGNPNLEEIAKNAHALIEREYTYEAAVEGYRKILAGLSLE